MTGGSSRRTQLHGINYSVDLQAEVIMMFVLNDFFLRT
jgi:hypothetical protein